MVKQSLGTLLMLSFSLSLNAQTSMTQANSATYLKAPEAPKYETCSYTSVENGHGGTYQVQDSACVARNQQKQREYNAAVEAYNRSTRMMSANASTTVKPKEPEYENCQSVDNGNGGYNYDYGCQSRNQAKQHDYDIQMMGWNKLQQEQANQNQAEQSEAQRKALEESKAQSATEALQKAQEQNIKSANKSSTAATITMLLSVASGVKFAATCASCAGGCCQWGYLAASIAFGMMSSQNSRQAAQNNASAYAACTTQAQLNSTTVTDCSSIGSGSSGTTGSATNPTSTAASNVFDSNGNCVASDKTICDKVTENLPPGTNIKDVAPKINSFATSAPYKFNSDGSVTTKDGKTFKPEDFKSKEAMIAAGLTPDQAAAAMGALSKAGGLGGLPGSAGEKGLADLKSNGSDGKSHDLNGYAISGSGDSGANGSGSGANASGALSSKSISGSGGAGGKNGFGKRTPAGAGLTRDFNGEAIGSAGDDIFSMMNRRYKMKTAQDSFINN